MTRRSTSRARFDVTLVSKVVVSLLFLVALAAAAMSVRADGFDSLATTAGSLYVTGALAVGVLRDATDTRRWRVAFFGGVAVFGLAEYAASSEWFDLLLAAAGAAMLAGDAFDRFSG
ncbi:hypothetical protein M0R88_03305 [Halorussus gelatinilyticus]|uniref:Uncharacterized protein n=1 Tax=Halorussus gelatinilyticus TaxID=2937524 RepID=A0A8U0IJ49_9EURY|nr:hypothetical protein [Halorussus gelatinilyticus]UPW01137.1 hypothetical protein M0R88_03305 [Halorussus gelatinilyticus]